MSVVDVRHARQSAAGRQVWQAERPMWRRGMASKGRATMYGTMHALAPDTKGLDDLAQCFTAHHPDADAWTPHAHGNPHSAVWVRFEPTRIYYVGGFGDEHYIGDIHVDTYRAAKLGLHNDADTANALYIQSSTYDSV